MNSKLQHYLLFIILSLLFVTSCQTQLKIAGSKAQDQYFTQEELVALGNTLTKISATETLLCNLESSHCICLETLPCDNTNDCVSFDENISGFKQALKRTHEQKVDCNHADTGVCDDFKYFNFIGDIHRREMRWFDSNNKLVGQRNATDYNAYCKNQTSVTYQGKIPKCAGSVQTEQICGDTWSHTLSPIKTLGL